MTDNNNSSDGWGWSSWTSKITQVAKESISTATEATKVYAEATKNLITDLTQQSETSNHIRLPWELPDELKEKEEIVKKQILLLSQEKYNFLKYPDDTNILQNWDYEFDVDLAQALMQADEKLSKMRFLLVPYKIKEDPFWKNYFARIYIIKSTIMDPSLQNISGKTTGNSFEKDIIIKHQSPSTSNTPAKHSFESLVQTNIQNTNEKKEEINDDEREAQLKKELQELGEDFDLDIEFDDIDDSDLADIEIIEDPELDLLLNE